MTKCCHDKLKQSSFWGPEVRFQASRKISFSANQRKPLLKNSTGLSWSVSYQSRPRSFWPKRSSRRWILLSLCIPLIHLSRHEMGNSGVSVTRREKKIRRRTRRTANLQIFESFKFLKRKSIWVRGLGVQHSGSILASDPDLLGPSPPIFSSLYCLFYELYRDRNHLVLSNGFNKCS